jgi:DNA (cytosine-5)-methyltransferase 1
MNDPLTFGSLFSGIGGMDLGLERAGMRCVWQSEIDPYASRVLRKHWPSVPNLGDITRIDWSGVERPDLVCGGFPCQDISFAGKGAGLAGERSGLWYELARCVREVRPRIVLVENVAALFVRGLDAVLGTLASLGYDCEWACLPAAAVGAPHIRDRVFIVAHTRTQRWVGWAGLPGVGRHQAERCEAGDNIGYQSGLLPHAHRDRFRVPGRGEDGGEASPVQGEAQERERLWPDAGPVRGEVPDAHGGCLRWAGTDTDTGDGAAVPPKGPIRLLHRSDGRQVLSYAHGERREERDRPAVAGGPGWARILDRDSLARFRDSIGLAQWGADPADEPQSGVGRVAAGVPRRMDRLRGLGNAVVPQVAEYIGRRILDVFHDGAVR